MKRRVLAILIVISMLILMLPQNVFATGTWNLTYQASSNFSGTQGPTWYYMQHLSTDAYTTDKYQQLSNYDSSYGYTSWHPASQQYPFVSATDMCVGQSSPYEDAVMMWSAPQTGVVSIGAATNIRKSVSGGSGVHCYIYINNDRIWNYTLGEADLTGVPFNPINISVVPGDQIYFIISYITAPTCDEVKWDSTINYGDVGAATVYQGSTGFSGTQGANQWSYMYKSSTDPYVTTSYTNMQTYGNSFGQYEWTKNAQTYPFVSSSQMCTGSGSPSEDAARVWKAPHSGVIAINSSGNINLKNSGGDGVKCMVYKQNNLIWQRTIPGTDTTGSPMETTYVDVSTNDQMYFVLNCISSFSYDITNWDPIINYVYDNQYTTGSEVNSSNTNFDTGTTQPYDQWGYYSYNGTTYSPLTKVSGHNQWSNGGTFNAVPLIEPTDMLPSTTLDSVLSWQANSNGFIIISNPDNIRMQNAGGDGVICSIKYYNYSTNSTTTLWTKTIAGNDLTGNYFTPIDIPVANLDKIYFDVNSGGSNSSYDNVMWQPVIRTYSTNDALASAGYSTTTNGANNWSYMYNTDGIVGDIASYQMMTYNSTYGFWTEPSKEFPFVSQTYLCVGQSSPSENAARVWTAPKSGAVVISSNGNIREQVSGGDGVEADIYDYSSGTATSLLQRPVNDMTGQAFTTTVHVSAGDKIYFIIHSTGTTNCDELIWDASVSYDPSIFSVADFGAVGDGVNDDGPAISMAISAARNFVTAVSGDTNLGISATVRFEKSKSYYIGRKDWTWPYFDLSNSQNITLKGDGDSTSWPTLLFTKYNTPFLLNNCIGDTIQGLCIDYVSTDLRFTQGTVVSVNPSTYSFNVTIENGYPLPPTYTTVNTTNGWNLGTYVAGGGFHGLLFDGSTYKRKAGMGAYDHFELSNCTLVSGSTYTFTLNSATQGLISDIAANDRFTYGIEDFDLSQSYVNSKYTWDTGFQIHSSSNITLQDINIYATGCLEFDIAYNTGNITVTDVNAKRTSDRLISAISDVLHCSNNRGQLIIQNCDIESAGDDCVNINTLTDFVQSKPGGTNEVLISPCDFTYKGQAMQNGDTLMFFNPSTEAELGTAIANMSSNSWNSSTLICDVTLSGFSSGFSLANLTASGTDLSASQVLNTNEETPNTVIQNNTFKPVCRNALLTRFNGGTISNNTIYGDNGGVCGINMAYCHPEGPWPANTATIYIDKNTITGMSGTNAAGIEVLNDTDGQTMQGNIVIESNSISMMDGFGILLYRANNITLTQDGTGDGNNSITMDSSCPNLNDICMYIYNGININIAYMTLTDPRAVNCGAAIYASSTNKNNVTIDQTHFVTSLHSGVVAYLHS